MTENAVIVRDEPTVTPMSMLQIALQKGASIEQMTQLLDLQDRWEKTEARKAYVVAMGKFKADAPRIVKDKAVSFGAGKTSYKHATLDNASEQIGAALAKHGISHRWNVEQKENGVISVTCILTHVLGHSEQVSMSAQPDTSGSKNSIQAIGSTTSYLQRYTLFAATGLAPKDADTDGAEPHTLAESVKASYLERIEALKERGAGNALWKEIAGACQVAGDVPAFDELKGKMSKKLKSLPEDDV